MSLRAGFDDYSVDDVAFVMTRGAGKSWGALIAWLEESGNDDDTLDQSSVDHLTADLRTLDNEDIEFAEDPHEAFMLARQHCEHVRTTEEGIAAPVDFFGAGED